jgi:hypothetical protein
LVDVVPEPRHRESVRTLRPAQPPVRCRRRLRRRLCLLRLLCYCHCRCLCLLRLLCYCHCRCLTDLLAVLAGVVYHFDRRHCYRQ